MNVHRGDVVLIDYPYAAGSGTKVRPVLVIQNDRDNQRLLNTIVAQITSVTRSYRNFHFSADKLGRCGTVS
jgi:mRNA interferase MazF